MLIEWEMVGWIFVALLGIINGLLFYNYNKQGNLFESVRTDQGQIRTEFSQYKDDISGRFEKMEEWIEHEIDKLQAESAEMKTNYITRFEHATEHRNKMERNIIQTVGEIKVEIAKITQANRG